MWVLLVFSLACAPSDGGAADARAAGCVQGDEDGYADGTADGAYAASAFCAGGASPKAPDFSDAPFAARAYCDGAAAAKALDNTVGPCVPAFVEGYEECYLSAYEEGYTESCP